MKKYYAENDKGFTLTELLVVMAIIGILGAVAVTGYIGVTLKAARTEAYSNLEALRLLEEQFHAERANYTINLGACAPDNPGNEAIIRNGGGDPNNALPGFSPGTGASFSYCIQQNVDINGAATATPCFRAQAFGNTTARVAGDVFMIDCNNNRNF